MKGNSCSLGSTAKGKEIAYPSSDVNKLLGLLNKSPFEFKLHCGHTYTTSYVRKPTYLWIGLQFTVAS